MSISFIVPAFNCENTIEESIDSIYNDNFVNGDEVIIIDDASTDNTVNIIMKLKNQYPDLRVFNHNINKGSAAAGRNTGIDISKNELLFCLDADNILVPGSIKKLKEFLLLNDADIAAFGEIHYFLNDTRQFTHKWELKGEIFFLDNINSPSKTPCSSGNYLFTKESWKRAGRYIENIGGAYDSWAFGTKQLAEGCKMITLPNTHYLHRYGYDSTFVRDSNKLNASLTILQVLIPYLSMLHPHDINYITSEYARNTWFDNIEKRVIRLKEKNYKLSTFKRVVIKINNFFSQKIYN